MIQYSGVLGHSERPTADFLWCIMTTSNSKWGVVMSYHHDPVLAARLIHLTFCGLDGVIDPERVLYRMGVTPPESGRTAQIEAIGQRILADETDIEAFMEALEALNGIHEL